MLFPKLLIIWSLTEETTRCLTLSKTKQLIFHVLGGLPHMNIFIEHRANDDTNEDPEFDELRPLLM